MAHTTNRATARPFVFRFGGGTADGTADLPVRLGEKGASLASMARLGLPVPPGFTISTDVCGYANAHGGAWPDGLTAEIDSALAEIGLAFDAAFGDARRPLLVSVRSGAPMTMPGLTASIVNIGLTDVAAARLAAAGADIQEPYARFIASYAVHVLGIDESAFDPVFEGDDMNWQVRVAAARALVEERTGKPFPQDARAQLAGAIAAVHASWMGPNAARHRRLFGIPDAPGAAVTVQAMVLPRQGRLLARGTVFTRDAQTGAHVLNGDWQGTAVPHGKDPTLFDYASKEDEGPDGQFAETVHGSIGGDAGGLSLEAALPEVHAQLAKACDRLERHERTMQEVEWLHTDGQLWLIQARSGRPSTNAALRIAIEMAEAGTITRKDALKRIDPMQLEHLLHVTIDPEADAEAIAMGLPSSPGAACGEIVFTPEAGERLRAQGRPAILVREEMAPADVRGMQAVVGTITTRGGLTGHAEVVARGMGRPFVSALRNCRIDEATGLLITPTLTLREGDLVTLDGSTGHVFKGRVPLTEPQLTGDFAKLMTWADGIRRLKVRANAETPREAAQARAFGAEGIGLCRTEHMFFAAERMLVMREMILAESESGRRAALARLLPMQRQDFIELFEIMAGLPVTIRLLDPPLHEFLPHDPLEIAEIASDLGLAPQRVERRLRELTEINPMLGLRGCRLGIVHPEIPEMQARAIFEAAIAAGEKTGKPVRPEIMVPLVSYAEELRHLKEVIARVAETVAKEAGVAVPYHIGTMIEVPRAALTAGEIALQAEFFSFGTNDLTQMTLGLSRDDAAPILAAYADRGIVPADPFLSLDQTGVGELVAVAARRGRAANPKLKLGICGEHGADPDSIAFCERAGLDYVSCSPFRVPIARLAAARVVE